MIGVVAFELGNATAILLILRATTCLRPITPPARPPSSPSSIAALAPAELRGSAFGLLATGQAGANLIASAPAGILWSAISPIAAFIFLAAAMLVALPLILTSKID